MASLAKRFRVHTLCFKNKLAVPQDLTKNGEEATIAHVRTWIAEKMHFPKQEAQLLAQGQQLNDDELLSSLGQKDVFDLHLVCTSPPPGAEKHFLKIYVMDTTRQPNKTYAVKMEPMQTVDDLKKKIFEKSSCTVPPRHQLLTCRGKILDQSYSLREYTISQRKDRVVCYLSKDPTTSNEEELRLTVNVPVNGAIITTEMRADQTVLNLRKLLHSSHGIASEKYTLFNAAGLVLQDQMTLRTACTVPIKMPTVAAGQEGMREAPSGPTTTNLSLYAVPIPRERFTGGMPGVNIYLNAQHHASLGIQNLAAKAPVSLEKPHRKKRTKSKSKSKKCTVKKSGGSKVLKGFRGLFKRKAANKASSKENETPKTLDKVEHSNAKRPIANKQKKKKKKNSNSYKNRMKAMMKNSRYSSQEDKIEQYRNTLRKSMGGGQFRRVDSI